MILQIHWLPWFRDDHVSVEERGETLRARIFSGMLMKSLSMTEEPSNTGVVVANGSRK